MTLTIRMPDYPSGPLLMAASMDETLPRTITLADGTKLPIAWAKLVIARSTRDDVRLDDQRDVRREWVFACPQCGKLHGSDAGGPIYDDPLDYLGPHTAPCASPFHPIELRAFCIIPLPGESKRARRRLNPPSQRRPSTGWWRDRGGAAAN